MGIHVGKVVLPDTMPCAENADRTALYSWYEPTNEAQNSPQGKIAEKLRQIVEAEVTTEEPFVTRKSLEQILSDTQLKAYLIMLLEKAGADTNLIEVLNKDLRAVDNNNGAYKDENEPKVAWFNTVLEAQDELLYAMDLDDALSIAREVHQKTPEGSGERKTLERYLAVHFINLLRNEMYIYRDKQALERALIRITEVAMTFDLEVRENLQKELRAEFENTAFDS